MRLDQYVTDNAEISRNKSQALIKSWNITVNWKTITKVWLKLDWSEKVIINLSEESQYVSRSALKLKFFLDDNSLNVDWFRCLDIWSSTWWFCQVLLEKNVSSIYAVDVWTSQLHDKIKENSKIISVENTDIRKFEKINLELDLITCDVSFISLDLIIDSIINQMWINTIWLILFKPQFEVWSKYINKKWVVKDWKISEKKLTNFLDSCKMKWLDIIRVEKSKLEWENWNQEIIIQIKKNNIKLI